MVTNLGAPSISGDRGSTLHTASAAAMDELSRGLQTVQSPQQLANTIGATGCQPEAPPCHCASCQREKLRHLLDLLDLLLKQKASHGSNPAPGSITWQKNIQLGCPWGNWLQDQAPLDVMQGLGEVEQEHPKPPGSPSLPLPTLIPCRLSTGWQRCPAPGARILCWANTKRWHTARPCLLATNKKH